MTDPTEEFLTNLRPAPPSAELMARLRAARPERGFRFQVSAFRFQVSRRVLTWVGGLGAAAALVVLLQWTSPRTHTVAAADAADQTAIMETTPREAFQIFLPVESTRRLISLQPAAVIQEPDQPPQRFARAVWIDDVTAVGAETDAALHLRRAHEAYVPVSSPVY